MNNFCAAFDVQINPHISFFFYIYREIHINPLAPAVSAWWELQKIRNSMRNP